MTKLRLIPALGATAAALILISSADAALFGGRPFVTTAFAETAEAEKQAFEDAKSLGTVEAWDAFLSHYPSGFYADLAHAYVKKIADRPPAPASTSAAAGPAPAFDYPMVAGTWGGIVRSGPGQNNDKVASLSEGEEVTLMGPPVPVTPNDYPWFKIAFRDGTMGYMWGGLLCSTGAERPDLFKLCTFKPYRASGSESGAAPKPAHQPKAERGSTPSWCASPSNGAETAICGNSDLQRLDGVLNVAYRRAKSDSPKSVEEIDREQRHWIGRRNACGNDPQCVLKRYNEQIQFLESYYGN